MDDVCAVCKHDVADCTSDASQHLQNGVCPGCGHNYNTCTWENLLERAKAIIKATGKTYLQGPLKVPYITQVKMLDQLESEGLIGPIDAGRPREVYL